MGIELWLSIPFMTFVCGFWASIHIFSTILGGGVGKNGSTVAVSFWQLTLSLREARSSFKIDFFKKYIYPDTGRGVTLVCRMEYLIRIVNLYLPKYCPLKIPIQY